MELYPLNLLDPCEYFSFGLGQNSGHTSVLLNLKNTTFQFMSLWDSHWRPDDIISAHVCLIHVTPVF